MTRRYRRQVLADKDRGDSLSCEIEAQDLAVRVHLRDVLCVPAEPDAEQVDVFCCAVRVCWGCFCGRGFRGRVLEAALLTLLSEPSSVDVFLA